MRRGLPRSRAARPTAAPRSAGSWLLARQGERNRRALEPRDRAGGRKLLRTVLGAAHVRVAGMAARVARDRAQALPLAGRPRGLPPLAPSGRRPGCAVG